MALSDSIDRTLIRVLRVEPKPLPNESVNENAPEERAFGLALLISALRCTLQYVVLPVVLPLLGVAGEFSLAIVILFDLVALGLLVSSLRYFWRTMHPRRFDILPLTGAILLLIVGSLAYDVWTYVK